MIGLGILFFLAIWAVLSLLIARLLSKSLLRRFITDATTGNISSKGVFVTLLLGVLVFFAPIADEIISYPSYYKMCEDGGKYKFASGMDEKKVFGREFYATSKYELTGLFPSFNTLSPIDDKGSGVIIQVDKTSIIDTNTGEILLKSVGFKPIHSFFAIPWDGQRIPWLLQECGKHVGKNGGYNQQLIGKLQLKRTISLDEIRQKRGEI